MVTLTAPVNGSSIKTGTPTLSGVAGSLTGDSGTVTVTIYEGAGIAGPVEQTIPVTAFGRRLDHHARYARCRTAPYTARATQSDAAGNTGQARPTRSPSTPSRRR